MAYYCRNLLTCQKKVSALVLNQAMLVSSFKLYVAPIRIINNIVGVTGEIHGCIVFQENVYMTGRRRIARKCGSIQVVNQTDFSFFPFPRGSLNGITIFWDETPCSLLNMKQGFRLICSLHLQGRSVNSVEFLETLVSMYQTTRRHKTKILYFCIRRHLKVKSK